MKEVPVDYQFSSTECAGELTEADCYTAGDAFFFRDALRDQKRQVEHLLVKRAIRFRRQGTHSYWEDARLLNVSETGIRLTTRDPLAAGCTVKFDFDLPKAKQCLLTDGLVVWSKPTSSGDEGSECGITFNYRAKLHGQRHSLCCLNDRMCELVLRYTPAGIDCYPARTLDEIKSAFRLVYREYLTRGYCRPQDSGMYYTLHCLLPLSRTFVLKQKEALLGTVSLIPDSPCGLPMEPVFPEVVNELRRPAKQVAEVSMFSLSPGAFRNKDLSLTDFHKLTGTFWLFKTMLDYARCVAGVTDLLIVVHPKLERLYRSFAFRPAGKVAAYLPAGEHPGLPMHLDLEALEKHLSPERKFRDFFFDQTLSLDFLTQSYPWTSETLDEFLEEKWHAWPETFWVAREYLRLHYPQLTLPEWDEEITAACG